MKNKDEILKDLAHCTGSDEYIRYLGGMLLTQGATEFARLCGAFWLLDILVSVQGKKEVKAEEFQVLKIKKTGDRAVVTVEDGNDNVLYKQNIPFTDFPLDEYQLFAIHDGTHRIILLPSEY